MAISINDLLDLTTRALQGAGASALQAQATARALVAADTQGLASHGVSRVPMYAAHLRAGRVDGHAVPTVHSSLPAAALVDAADGFAFAACELAVQQVCERALAQGVAVAGVCNSHHFGAAGHHLMPAAERGLVAMAFGNSPAAMPVAGGRRALLGTNPMAAAFPRRGATPVLIDLSLSEVARGKLMVAAKQGQPIPLGWALDENGQPTTDAQAGLRGSMLPFGSAQGGVKGAMLGLMVEMLVVSLTGARFGAEADSFFEDQGNRPRIGQLFMAFNPAALAGAERSAERIEALIAAMLVDPDVRLPGQRREQLATRAASSGLELSEQVLAPLRELAGG